MGEGGYIHILLMFCPTSFFSNTFKFLIILYEITTPPPPRIKVQLSALSQTACLDLVYVPNVLRGIASSTKNTSRICMT